MPAFWDVGNCPESTSLHGAICQKAVIFILTAMRIWNLTCQKKLFTQSASSAIQKGGSHYVQGPGCVVDGQEIPSKSAPVVSSHGFMGASTAINKAQVLSQQVTALPLNDWMVVLFMSMGWDISELQPISHTCNVLNARWWRKCG
jgi:hypothetical protein